jgi:hypothetical protein
MKNLAPDRFLRMCGQGRGDGVQIRAGSEKATCSPRILQGHDRHHRGPGHEEPEGRGVRPAGRHVGRRGHGGRDLFDASELVEDFEDPICQFCLGVGHVRDDRTGRADDDPTTGISGNVAQCEGAR